METFLEIQITPAKNGIKVIVGCHEFVYMQDKLTTFLEDLYQYLTDPEGTKKKILKRWGLKEEVSDQPDAPRTRSNRIVDAGRDEAKEARESIEVPGPTRERSR